MTNYYDKKKFPSTYPDDKWVVNGYIEDRKAIIDDFENGLIDGGEVVKIDRKNGYVHGTFITNNDGFFEIEDWSNTFIDCDNLKKGDILYDVLFQYTAFKSNEDCRKIPIEERVMTIMTDYDYPPTFPIEVSLNNAIREITKGECVFVNGNEKFCPR